MRTVLGIMACISVVVVLSCLALAQDPNPPAPNPPAPNPPAPNPPAPNPPAPQQPAQPEDKEPDNSPPDQKAIDEAVKKGVEWLVKLQQDDGSFKTTYSSSYPMGSTALALLALLKCGADPGSPAIIKGFSYLFKLPLQRTYSVAIYVMAIEALYAPSEKQLERSSRPYATVVRDNFRRAAPGVRELTSKMIEWIISQQQANVWRYPTGGEDLSNTQYALLALYSGMRMGYRVPPEVFRKAADYMIVNQETEGPEVTPFPVPAADFSIKDLQKLEKEIKQALREDSKARAKPGKDEEDSGPSTTVIEDPYSRFGVERNSHKMFARGWSYTAPPAPQPGQPAPQIYATGSMTTAGLACSVIIKAGMEGSSLYNKAYKDLLDRCIRDGAAWLSKFFSVTGNPTSRGSGGGTSYLYYYLYGLERAGILTLCVKFGEHDWYNKGAKHIVKEQKPDGHWVAYERPAPAPQPGGNVVPPQPADHTDTCFALLFLKRATVPIVTIPSQTYTGEDLFGDKTQKQEMPGAPGKTENAPPEEAPKTPPEAGPQTPAEPETEPKKDEPAQEPGKPATSP
jgi:hypothetical protein